MALNLTQKLVQSHLAEGDLTPGGDIAHPEGRALGRIGWHGCGS